MKALIVGDLHLGKGIQIGRPGIGNNLNSRIIDQIKLLNWVADQAVENYVNAIILTGDICEAVKPDYILIEIFLDFLKKCISNNIEVHIIAGNHDLKRTGNRYSTYLDLISGMELDKVFIYKDISTVYYENIAFTFMPFRDLRSLNCKNQEEAFVRLSGLLAYESAGIPAAFIKVLVGHLAVEGSIYVGDEFDNSSNELMCPTSLFEKYNYTFMGHVHKPQELEEDPYVGHVGSLDLSDFGETDHTKIIILFDSDLNNFKEISVPSRPLRHIPVNVPSGFDPTTYVLKKIKAVHQKTPLTSAIVKIEIKLMDDAIDGTDRQSIENEVYNLGAFFIILNESKMVSSIPLITQSQITNEIQPKAAVKVWAEKEDFLSDKEKNDFIDLANSIIIEYQLQN